MYDLQKKAMNQRRTYLLKKRKFKMISYQMKKKMIKLLLELSEVRRDIGGFITLHIIRLKIMILKF